LTHMNRKRQIVVREEEILNRNMKAVNRGNRNRH
jgi:hypothetical protein